MATTIEDPAPDLPTSMERSAHGYRVLRWMILALPVVVLLVGCWHRHALFDDAFINLRVVQQIEHGNGPVFNAGQRVEAITSPLWLWILVVLDLLLPLRSEWVALLGGIAFGALGLVAVMAGSSKLTGADDRRRLPLPVGALALVAITPMWSYTASGLENGLSLAWIGGSLWVLGRWATDRRRLSLGAAVLIGLGTTVRPELVLISLAALAVVVALDGSSAWRRVALVASAAAVPAAYQVFRMGYYGMLIANSAIAKSAGRSRWDEGWSYLGRAVWPYRLWFPLGVLLLGAGLPLVRAARERGWRRDRRLWVAVAFVVGGLAVLLFVVRVGGDYMHARLLLPGLIALFAPFAVVPITRRWAWAGLVLPWAVVCTLLWRAPGDHYSFFTPGRHPVTIDDFRWGHGGFFGRAFTRPGVYYGATWLGPSAPGQPERVVALYGVGVSGYALGPDVTVVDLLGLGDTFTAHLKLEHRGLNSHERPLPAPWIVARLLPPGVAYDKSILVQGSDQVEFHVTLGAAQIGDPRQPFERRVADARAALGCPRIEALFATTQAPLTPRRFLSNLTHSPERTAMLIEAEPEDALARSCR